MRPLSRGCKTRAPISDLETWAQAGWGSLAGSQGAVSAPCGRPLILGLSLLSDWRSSSSVFTSLEVLIRWEQNKSNVINQIPDWGSTNLSMTLEMLPDAVLFGMFFPKVTFPSHFLLWQNTHNIKSAVLTIPKCTASGMSSFALLCRLQSFPEVSHLPLQKCCLSRTVPSIPFSLLGACLWLLPSP